MTDTDAIYVCTLDPGDDKYAETCVYCNRGKGPGHGVRRPITHDMFGVPVDQEAGKPVFGPTP